MPKDHVQIVDYESGEFVWVTKQTYEAMQYWRQQLQWKINKDKVLRGKIIIISTPADETNTNDYKNLWEEQTWDN